jgi:hypothetical protein
MCVNCMAGAMTAAAGAVGTRAVLAARIRARFGERALRRMTAALIAVALAAVAVGYG